MKVPELDRRRFPLAALVPIVLGAMLMVLGLLGFSLPALLLAIFGLIMYGYGWVVLIVRLRRWSFIVYMLVGLAVVVLVRVLITLLLLL